MDVDALPDEAFEKLGISREGLREVQRQQALREEQAPAIGDPAPAFRIERLTPTGQRTGTHFELASARGRPVALVFGSYT